MGENQTIRINCLFQLLFKLNKVPSQNRFGKVSRFLLLNVELKLSFYSTECVADFD